MAQIHMRKAKQTENPQKQKLYNILHNLSRHFFNFTMNERTKISPNNTENFYSIHKLYN